MSTHSERIREAERKVIEAAKDATRRGELRVHSIIAMERAVEELLLLEFQACPKCGGDGHHPDYISRAFMCPAGCDNGRKREEDK